MNNANTQYVNRLNEVKDKLEQLEKLVQAHSEAQEADTKDWGYVGDMSNVAKKLDEMMEFFVYED